MMRPNRGISIAGLLIAVALPLSAPRVAEAAKKGIVPVNPIVMPVSDPFLYTIPLYYYPDASINERLVNNDYFTISGVNATTGIGSINSVSSPSPFVYDVKNSDPTDGFARFNYIGTTVLDASNAFGEFLGNFVIDSVSYTGFVTVTYHDHSGSNPNSSPPNNSGSNTVPAPLVPEPTSMILLAIGAVGGLYLRKRVARPAN